MKLYIAFCFCSLSFLSVLRGLRREAFAHRYVHTDDNNCINVGLLFCRTARCEFASLALSRVS